MWNDNDTTSASDDLSGLPRGPGAVSDVATPTPARAAPVGSIAKNTRLGDDPKEDVEYGGFAERVGQAHDREHGGGCTRSVRSLIGD